MASQPDSSCALNTTWAAHIASLRPSHRRRAHSFLKSSLGIRSEHRFRDTVEEHVSLGFPPDNRPISRRSQFQGFGNTSTCPEVRRVRRKVPDPVGGRSSNTALESHEEMGGQNQRKRRVSALSLTGACRFTYL